MEILDRNNYRVVNLTDGNRIKDVANLINRNKADGVNFNFIKNFPSDINDIIHAKNIKLIQVNDYSWTFDYSVINELSTLEVLDIYTTDRREIKFSNFPFLKGAAIFWRPKAKSIYNCKQIKHLFIGKYTEKDLLKFEKLEGLEYLRINTGSVKSLNGIESLKNLKTLMLMQTTKLEDISGIEKLQSLEKLLIYNCRNINNIDLVSDLKKSINIEISGTTPQIIINNR